MWVTCVKKNFDIRTSIKKLLAKYRFFKKLPQISHICKNRYFSCITVIFLEQLLLPYIFHGSGMRGILFFNFASYEPLNLLLSSNQRLLFIIGPIRFETFPYYSIRSCNDIILYLKSDFILVYFSEGTVIFEMFFAFCQTYNVLFRSVVYRYIYRQPTPNRNWQIVWKRQWYEE